MIKITQYIAPAKPDSYMLNKPWCVSIEYPRANGTMEFKAYCDEFTISMILSDEWQDQCRENIGQNIALITIEEEES